jgi:hypothetical protein
LGIVGLAGEQMLTRWQKGYSVTFEVSYLIGVLILGAFIAYLNEVKVVRKLRSELDQLRLGQAKKEKVRFGL